jgi:alpha-tubulin suppressor-like RCC1 family protein
VGSLPLPWVLAGIGDWEGDGDDDWVWQNLQTGEIVLTVRDPTDSTSNFRKIYAGYVERGWALSNLGFLAPEGGILDARPRTKIDLGAFPVGMNTNLYFAVTNQSYLDLTVFISTSNTNLSLLGENSVNLSRYRSRVTAVDFYAKVPGFYTAQLRHEYGLWSVDREIIAEVPEDFNHNDIPDVWENQYFGQEYLTDNPKFGSGGDFDEDGQTNLEEYQQGTNPRDYYNGLMPVITKLSGDLQTGHINTILPEPFRVEVKSSQGQVMVHAPVRFRVLEGDGQFVRDRGSGDISVVRQIQSPILAIGGGPIKDSVVVRTDDVGIASVRFQLPLSGAKINTILATPDVDGEAEGVIFSATTIEGPEIQTARSVAGSESSFWLRSDGKWFSWGRNLRGELGSSSLGKTNQPTLIEIPENFDSLAAGSRHGLAVSALDGKVWSWGENDRGQLGDGTHRSRGVPKVVLGLTQIRSVSAGGGHSLALGTDGRVWSWGANDKGQLGLGHFTELTTPQIIPGLSNVSFIAAGRSYSLASDVQGQVWSWGLNRAGQLGLGDRKDRKIPTIIPNLVEVAYVAASVGHSIAIRSDGSLWSWGANYFGELGDGTTKSRVSPGPVTGLNQVYMSRVVLGMHFSVALQANGSVWSWGANGRGQLGLGDKQDRLLPSPVSLPPIQGVSCGADHVLATTQLDVWTWGDNRFGQLGQAHYSNESLPMRIQGISSILSEK